MDELKVRSSGELPLASHLLTLCRVSVVETLLQLTVAKMLTVGGNNNDTLRNMLVILHLSAFTVRCAHSCVFVCVFTVMASELPFLQTRLRAAESTLEQLRRKGAGHHHHHHTRSPQQADVTSSQQRPLSVAV